MGFDGVFHSVKDYLQPVLKMLALTVATQWIASGNMSEIQQTTLLVGPVYFALYLLSGVSSRQAHRFEAAAGGPARLGYRGLFSSDGAQKIRRFAALATPKGSDRSRMNIPL